MYPNITEIQVIRCEASATEINKIIDVINKHLNNGWIIVDISTHGPWELPGGQNGTRYNFYTYHLGKLKTITHKI